MRQVGSLSNEQHAEVFADYLVAQGISAHAEEQDGQWVIWVRDENHLKTAAETLEVFAGNPEDTRYRDVSRQAAAVRQEELRRRQQARKNTIEMRTRWGRGIARRAPLVTVLIGLSVLVAILTQFGEQIAPLKNRLTICPIEPVGENRIRFPSDYFHELKQGQLWRAVTPIFIHFGIIHLLFNMYMLYYLGSQIESRYGSVWFGVLVLVIAVTSNLGQTLLAQYFPGSPFGSGPNFGGMSGVDYGLFGYIWMKTVYDPGAGLYVSRQTVFMLMAWFLICFGPWMSIANGAHAVGLATGMAFGYAPELTMTLRRR
jgi:GlpG protein